MKFSLKLRRQLAAIANNPRRLAKDAPALCRASSTSTLAIRGKDGAALSAEDRKDLLARAVAKEEVELEVDVLAYEQKTGEQNRNFVRFRDGAMMSLGRTGKGTPFLRNHDQHDVQARGGTVMSSTTEKLAEGDYAVRQTVKLTAPWAVELALRGLLDSVSIGWNPTGQILCSACDAPIYTQCYHWPGDTLSEETLANGKPKLKRDPAGDIVVEWIFTEAELVETSFVNVPGVPAARVEEVRAALSAAFPGLRSDEDHEGSNNPKKELKMDKELLELLGLAENATEDQIAAAVKALAARAKADAAELAIHTKVLERLSALEADVRKREEDKFISDALLSGRIAKGDEEQWRALHSADAKRAGELMAKREPNSATPVGAPSQRDKDPTLSITGGEAPRTPSPRGSMRKQLATVLAQLAANPRAAAFAHHWFGFQNRDGKVAIPDTLGATSIANNADLDAARVGFHAAFLEQLTVEADPIADLFTEVPTNKKVEEWDWMGDLPDMEEWVGERKLASLEGFKLRLGTKKWQSGLRIKSDDIKDDALGLLPSQIAALADRARFHRYDRMVKLLMNGFDGASFSELGDGLAYDNAFFFSNAHRGGNDNKLTVALDANGIASAQLKMRRFKTYDGKLPFRAKGTHILAGPANEAVLDKILTQERLANGESNPNKGKYKPIISDLIDGTYANDWYMLDLSTPIRPFLLQMREEISSSAILGNQGSQQDSYQRFMFDEVLFGAEARYDVGYFEFRRIVGSRP